MTYHDNEFGKRNRIRPDFDRPARAHFNSKSWIIAALAALALVGVLMWAFDGDSQRTVSLNDANTAGATRGAPVGAR
jgi:hypothetical protein